MSANATSTCSRQRTVKVRRFAGLPVLRAVLKMTALALLILVIIPCQYALLPFGNAACRAARFWHRLICRILCIRVECVGQPLTGSQAVYVGNHLSYLDIPVVGGIVFGRFVAKADMQHWPLFGMLARFQKTVFISRRSHDAVKAIRAMDEALHRGDNLILFPEGTSSAGQDMFAFKSSAFSAPARHLKRGLCIQPFSINLAWVDGRKPVTVSDRNLYAYYDDMQLAGHLWQFMRTRGAHVRLVFHPALTAADGSHRKCLAPAAARAVASGLNGAYSRIRHAPLPNLRTVVRQETVP